MSCSNPAMAAETVTRPVRLFVEADCEIGGCSCPLWSDWYWAAVESAGQHPSAAGFEMLRRHGLISDDDAAEHDHRIADLMIEDGTHAYLAPSCDRATCSRALPPSTAQAGGGR